MKKLFCTSIAGLLIGNALPAFAASTTDLTVTGLITPSACTPSLSSGGLVEYGKVSAKDLDPIRTTILADARLEMEILCEGLTAMALKLIDNQQGTSINQYNLGLGLTSAQEKIGMVSIRFENPMADNVAVHVSESQDGGQTWAPNNGQAFYALSLHAPSNPADMTQPISSTRFTTGLKINAVIARADSLTLTGEEAFRANGTIEVNYL
ncbi:DUF1120 domain-containing protein [Pseudomonas reactans]|uniref:DUF1120 domain-containing protein n=1 Tax=Pseudomonas reactans TaxID=117680 RepID=UPI0015A2C06E|nr:DUF1120 domain-containing protein [Pseudomonas reactans]NWA65847.1 DUF1120 domain-containing protein [Pseudomonas reactans]